MSYDFLIVGAGLTGSTIAYELTKAGKSCLVIDKRDHIGGNIYTEYFEDIVVHKYGPHYFHTNSDRIWSYINNFATFDPYYPRIKVNYKEEIYSLPINLETWSRFGFRLHPSDIIEGLKRTKDNSNLEAYLLSMFPKNIYQTFFKGYTQKQWNKEPHLLPASIVSRLNLMRPNYDDRYFTDKYQAVPRYGYTEIIANMLDDIPVELGVDFLKDIRYTFKGNHVVYTGCIDEFFNYCLGHLEYRSLRFVDQVINTPDYQGIQQMNYTEFDIPWTRIIEHKHITYNPIKSEKTLITYEYPANYTPGSNPYYPVRDEENTKLYNLYKKLAKDYSPDFTFCGRLGSYQYLNMDQAIGQALEVAERLLHV